MTADPLVSHAQPPTRSRRRIAQLASAQGSAFSSQLVGAVQLLLLLRAGISRATDTYFLVFAASQLVTTIWVLGVQYPRQLAGNGKPWRTTTGTASALAVVATLTATAYAFVLGYPPQTVLLTSVPLLASAVAATRATVYACALACDGRPTELAGVALPANLGACLGLAAAAGLGSRGATSAMCIGLAVGNLATALVLGRRARHLIHGRTGNRPVSAGTTSLWFVVSSIAGGASPLLFQAALAGFPQGDLTTFSVMSKVGLAITGIGLNSVLPIFLSWRHVEHELLDRITWTSLGLCLPFAAVARTVGDHGVLDTGVLTVMVVWALICPATTITARLVILVGDQRFFRWTALANGIFTLAAATVAVVAHDVMGVAGGFLWVEASVTALMLQRVGKRVASRTTLGIAVVATFICVMPVPIGSIVALVAAVGVLSAWRRSHRPVEDSATSRPVREQVEHQVVVDPAH